MAKLDDWIDLANSTIRSLDGKQVSGLYSLEWPEAKRSLIADYEEEIEREQRSIVRHIRFASALLFGLTKRLTPPRRLLFALGFVSNILGLVMIVREGPTVTNLVALSAAFLIMMLLVGLELIDKLKYRDELELARTLQAGLIPEYLPDHPEYSMAATNRIANMVGGDIYDFVRLGDDRLAVLFGDASGHGMAAGLVMAVAQASFRTQLDVDPTPEAIVSSLNRILCRVGGPRSFFACVYLLFERNGEFVATVAGHPPLLHIGTDGRLRSQIGLGAYPLGIRADREWLPLTGRLQPGESLILHSDGLVEAKSEVGEDFGFDRVEQIAQSGHPWHPHELVERLLRDWEDFRGARPAQDDLSIAVIRRR